MIMTTELYERMNKLCDARVMFDNEQKELEMAVYDAIIAVQKAEDLLHTYEKTLKKELTEAAQCATIPLEIEREMIMFLAKPQFNGLKQKMFETKADAVKYLEEITGYEMKIDKKTGVYDWELVGKLVEVK